MEYRCELLMLVDTLSKHSNESLCRLQNDLKEVKKEYAGTEWDIYADWLTVLVESVILNNNEGLLNEEQAMQVIKKLLPIYEKAKKKEYNSSQIRILWHIEGLYWDFIKNYEQAFTYAKKIDQLVNQYPNVEYPEKARIYAEIGNQYYYFGNYETAFEFYSNALKGTISPLYQKTVPSAYNGIGLCYRKMNQLDSSNHYFLKLIHIREMIRLDRQDDWIYSIWEGIGKGNLGVNLYTQGKPDEAIPLLQSSLETTTYYKDYAFAASVALNLAKIYLDRKELKIAKEYGNVAVDYAARMDRIGEKRDLALFWNKYYTTTGETETALSYLDTFIFEQKRLEDDYNTLHLLRWQQKNHLAETAFQEKKIELEQLRSATYKRGVIVLVFALIVLTALSLLLSYLYRKKKNAYQALVKKGQEWADPQEIVMNEQDDTPKPEATEEEKELVKALHEKMSKECLYRNPELTMPQLASLLNTNRSVLSKSINTVEGKSFSILIGELRVKDAIRMLSDAKNDKMSIDYIAEMVGFNNRFTFSQVFKKLTGVTPSEFRNNRG
ncbi:helix-turn-helix domain-containing protein [Bacteroidales bacterium OttesenSCG-928-A14]|nr:helix-turn-helix domain-containing protein [Bacteroidales bacterium OttesenSCG-928-A14]